MSLRGVTIATCAAAVVQAAAANAADVASSAHTLGDLAFAAESVVVARVDRSEQLDDGRLLLHHLEVDRSLLGKPTGATVAAAEIRGMHGGSGKLAAGTRVLAMLAAPPDLSYLSTHIGDRSYRVAVGDREGIVEARSAADLAALVGSLELSARVRAARTAGARAAVQRELVFSSLESSSLRVLADGIVELGRTEALEPLTAEEKATVAAVIARSALDVALRARLIDTIADRSIASAAPVLAGVRAHEPSVLAALLAARARLGAPASKEELDAHLRSADERVRAAAAAALVDAREPGSREQVGRLAHDDESVLVRRAAIRALGRSGDESALEVLRSTFESDVRGIKQESARAILAIGGAAADDLLADLAIGGRSSETRRYAAMLLVTRNGSEHPAVRRVAAADPPPEVLRVLEHGLESTHSHDH